MHNIRELTRSNSIILAWSHVALLALFVLTSNPIFGVLLLLVSAFSIKSPCDLFPLLFVSNLFSNYFILWGNVSLGRIISIVFVGFMAFSALFKGSIRVKRTGLVYAVIIVEIVSWVFSEYEYIFGVTTVLNWLIIICADQIDIPQIDVRRLINNTFCYCAVVLICVCVSAIISPNYVDGRLSVGIEGSNANNFAMMIVQLTTYIVAFLLINNRRRFWELIAALTTFAVGAYLLLMSGSRTALIACVAAITVTLLYSGRIQKKSLRYFIILILSSILFLIVINYVTSGDTYLAQRFTVRDVMSSGGAGRMHSIMAALQHVIPNNILFGVGPSTMSETAALNQYGIGLKSCHNIVLSMLVQIGVVGAIVMFTFILSLYSECFKKMKQSALFIVPIASFTAALINGIGEIVYLERFFWCILSFVVILLNNSEHDGVSYEWEKGSL